MGPLREILSSEHKQLIGRSPKFMSQKLFVPQTIWFI